jgi:hypothetical protein
MSDKVDYEGLLIGYFTVWSNSSNDVFIGAILTVDGKGFPIEYRFTDAIEIDETQRIFFGNSIYKYLITEVMGKEIVSDLERGPTFILVNDEKFLSLKDVVTLPILFYDSETGDFVGDESDKKFVENIPNIYISLEYQEPFKRLLKAVDHTRKK